MTPASMGIAHMTTGTAFRTPALNGGEPVIHEVGTQRKVIHIDCDCFFAAVEMRDNPALVEVPIAIGGESDRRGVIATCNYPARRFGVRSAMATAQARKLCPQLVLMPGRMALYREVSKQVMAILEEYALQTEQVSVDEAYLEIAPHLNASAIAAEIRQRVRADVGITVSAGVAPNKFLAKIASDWNKPDGLFVIRPHQVEEFVADLPLTRIQGIGPAMEKKLALYKLKTCTDVRQWPLTELVRVFGRTGAVLYERARGIDHRLLNVDRPRKSLSVECTFAEDLAGEAHCLEQLPALWERWLERVERSGWPAGALAPFVKVKFADFSQTTMADSHEQASVEGFRRLLSLALKRENKAVRLLGIGGRLPEVDRNQLTLF
ncbi:DNA polymerase IV [Thalassolituus sp. LLYu03]|uniref:DNA polymerase IV n=1 Tax=Thalassolituus sp. LLYu03 TaxID=3421656 RepID=UPI003D2D4098